MCHCIKTAWALRWTQPSEIALQIPQLQCQPHRAGKVSRQVIKCCVWRKKTVGKVAFVATEMICELEVHLSRFRKRCGETFGNVKTRRFFFYELLKVSVLHFIKWYLNKYSFHSSLLVAKIDLQSKKKIFTTQIWSPSFRAWLKVRRETYCHSSKKQSKSPCPTWPHFSSTFFNNYARKGLLPGD